MRRILLHAPVLIVTFAVGLLFAPYDANSGVRGLFNWLAKERTNFRMSHAGLSEFYGRWGGSGAAVIEFGDGYIVDTEMGKSYSYRIVQRFSYPKGDKAVLIEVYDLGSDSNLRQFVYLGLNEGRLDYFGYNSREAYDQGLASAVVSMSRTF